MENITYKITEVYDNEVRLPGGETISRAEYHGRTGFPCREPDYPQFRYVQFAEVNKGD